ncbi:MAG: zf-HC2 domain-containing protein [Gammaproteobacteria bacterium]
MNCKQLIEQLDALLEGELSAAEERPLREHLSECKSCEELHRKHRRLLENAAMLARNIEPPVDLWPGIEARISNRARQPVFGIRAAAATAVLGFAALIALTVQQPNVNREVKLESVVTTTEPLTRQQARAQLVAKVSPTDLRYSPKTEAVLRKNIKVIEQAMAEIEAAIEADPNNPNLRQLLLTIYQQESQVVDSANRIQVQSAEGQGI